MTAVHSGDRKALARSISMVENETEGYQSILSLLKPSTIPVLGFTGPPGAGKSTLINSYLRLLTGEGKKIAVVAVDPTSPFNFGSLLGDRLRMAEHFTNEKVFIRSLATRGSLGGLSEKIIEVIDVLRSADFDFILVETVGVGQSEVEIAGLADTTIVVVVPESGDEVQTMKSGIMEIADIFVVNKSDRESADIMAANFRKMLHHPRTSGWSVPVIKTIGTEGAGVEEMNAAIIAHRTSEGYNEKKIFLLTEKVYQLIRKDRMKNISRPEIRISLEKSGPVEEINIYNFARHYYHPGTP